MSKKYKLATGNRPRVWWVFALYLIGTVGITLRLWNEPDDGMAWWWFFAGLSYSLTFMVVHRTQRRRQRAWDSVH